MKKYQVVQFDSIEKLNSTITDFLNDEDCKLIGGVETTIVRYNNGETILYSQAIVLSKRGIFSC